jgi:hypothetical protein
MMVPLWAYIYQKVTPLGPLFWMVAPPLSSKYMLSLHRAIMSWPYALGDLFAKVLLYILNLVYFPARRR